MAHTIISGVVGTGFWATTRSRMAVFISFFCGILIDVDHIFDYWIVKRRIPRSYHDLLNYCAKEKEGKLYLVFHSYEIIFLLWIGVVMHPFSFMWWAFAVGMTVHVLADNIGNPYRPFALFFIYRLHYGFEKKYIFPEDYYNNLK